MNSNAEGLNQLVNPSNFDHSLTFRSQDSNQNSIDQNENVDIDKVNLKIHSQLVEGSLNNSLNASQEGSENDSDQIKSSNEAARDGEFETLINKELHKNKYGMNEYYKGDTHRDLWKAVK